MLKSRHGLEIRAATVADAAAIGELLSASGHAVSVQALAARLDAIQHAPGTALLALEWGPPSGLVVLHWYPSIGHDHPMARITTILVGPDDRRRGIGRLLLKAAAQAARVAGCGGLELMAANEPTLEQFCRASGFTENGQCFARPLRKGSAR